MNRHILLLSAILICAVFSPAAAQVTVGTIATSFNGSGDVAVDKDGLIYVADFGISLAVGSGTQIRRFTPAGEQSVFASGFTGASGNEFDSDGNLYQSNINIGVVSKITPDGQVSAFAQNVGLNGPVGIALDENNNVYVNNCNANTISRITQGGSATVFSTSPLLACPNGLTRADDGNFYAVNFANSNVLRIDSNGVASILATLPGTGNGHIIFANGRLYITARSVHQVWQVELDGTASLLAGTGVPGNQDGPANTATLNLPNGIAASPDGNVIYVNSENNSNNNLNPMNLRAIYLTPPPPPDGFINAGTGGAWVNPEVAGQGFLFDVFTDRKELFIAWFTYQEGVDPTSVLPGERHRWYTIQGNYAGDHADLTIYRTGGGRFDSADAVLTDPIGQMTLDFKNCTEADLSYSFDDNGTVASASYTIQRLIPDNLCQEIIDGPPIEQPEVVLQYTGNAGVLVSAGDKRILIDGLHNGTPANTIFVPVPVAEISKMENAEPPYDEVDLILVTHGHSDHVGFTSMGRMLDSLPNARIAASPFTLGNIGRSSQHIITTIGRFQQESFEFDGIQLTIYSTRHFNQFGNNFSAVTNQAYLVEVGGKKIFHSGDIDYAIDNLSVLGLVEQNIDIAIIPTFNTLLSANTAALVDQYIKPKQLIATHLQSALIPGESASINSLFNNPVIFEEPGEQLTVE